MCVIGSIKDALREMKRIIITILAVVSSFHCVSQNTDYYDIAYSKIETMLKENSNSFKGKIILEGQGPFEGKTYHTGLDPSDFLKPTK